MTADERQTFRGLWKPSPRPATSHTRVGGNPKPAGVDHDLGLDGRGGERKQAVPRRSRRLSSFFPFFFSLPFKPSF